VVQRIQQQGWRVGNLDCVVIAEQPRIAPYVEAIRGSIAQLLNIEPARVNVKGKTTERLGFIGRGEAIAASAVVLLIGS
jgi:2-C-methyl-D-erythritol 2,4-cyclodiphosphate synthase